MLQQVTIAAATGCHSDHTFAVFFNQLKNLSYSKVLAGKL
jgi:hypothetical protein